MKARVKLTFTIVVVLCLSLGFFSGTSFASVIVNWSFDQPTGVADPTDILALNATLTNDSSSTSNLTIDYGGAGFSGGTFTILIYDFDFGTAGHSLASQLNGVVLAPGESHHFIFGTLTPIGTVPDGNYQSGTAYILTRSGQYYSSNSFQRTIVSSNVPEPATLLLFGSGLVGLLAGRRLKR